MCPRAGVRWWWSCGTSFRGSGVGKRILFLHISHVLPIFHPYPSPTNAPTPRPLSQSFLNRTLHIQNQKEHTITAPNPRTKSLHQLPLLLLLKQLRFYLTQRNPSHTQILRRRVGVGVLVFVGRRGEDCVGGREGHELRVARPLHMFN